LHLTARVGKVLREEGVEERVSHTDCRPLEPEQSGGKTDCLVLEQGPEALHGESAKGTLDNFENAELDVFSGNFLVAADLVENVLGEPGVGVVVVRDTVNGGNGLGLATARQQELGRLVKMEEEEAADEHEECDGPESQDEVSPAPVIRHAALAEGSIGRTREVGNESPGHCKSLAYYRINMRYRLTERGDQVTDGPENGK
jgi:hypothetical protein